jgi:hypothetical protein
MAKKIRYTARGFTASKNEYVTIDPDDMAWLIQEMIRTMANLAELTASTEGAKVLLDRNRELYGRRGKSEIAPGRDNTIFSVIGGVINNYISKDDHFKNDISLGQLPYIEHAMNETAGWLKREAIVFQNMVMAFE